MAYANTILFQLSICLTSVTFESDVSLTKTDVRVQSLTDKAFPNRFGKVGSWLEGRDPNRCPIKWKAVTTETRSEKDQPKTLVLLSASPVHAATCLVKQVRNMGGRQPQSLVRQKCTSAICRKLGSFFSFVAHQLFFPSSSSYTAEVKLRQMLWFRRKLLQCSSCWICPWYTQQLTLMTTRWGDRPLFPCEQNGPISQY